MLLRIVPKEFAALHDFQKGVANLTRICKGVCGIGNVGKCFLGFNNLT
jgi:hypothetical protein